VILLLHTGTCITILSLIPSSAVLKAPKQNWLDAMRNNAGRKSSSNRPLALAATGHQQEMGGAPGATARADEGTAVECNGKVRQFKVLYKFNEGYTNAVKRPLLMGELL